MPLFKQDATYYAQEVKAGRLTASQLVDWALENIQALNLSLHAVAHVQAENVRNCLPSLGCLFCSRTWANSKLGSLPMRAPSLWPTM